MDKPKALVFYPGKRLYYTLFNMCWAESPKKNGDYDMKTAVIGFPRIGADRELKFVTEGYFKGELTEEALLEEGARQRAYGWKQQADAGVDFISSNDFSHYDGLLDTAVLFHVIPKRYLDLEVSDLARYFAMARGYQGAAGNVKAQAMKKWFNTNYHYLVPEIEDDTEIFLAGDKPIREYREAKALGVVTKPTIVGPFTFLKLAKFVGKKTPADVVQALGEAYGKLVEALEAEGAEWIQLEEPYLVHDVDAADWKLFQAAYAPIFAAKKNVKLLLQTYFGDVRDVYKDLVNLDFDGIGLDFVEGHKSLFLVEKYGFPQDKVLFAGVVNGKNIWKNNYAKTKELVDAIAAAGVLRIALNTSCSLLHVPYTLESEEKLSDAYKKHFAYAKEKLYELKDLAQIVGNTTGSKALLEENASCFTERINSRDEAVQQRVKNIQPEDYTRHPSFDERAKIQKEALQLPLFPTTTIGSFPQTADVRKARLQFRRGELSREDYVAFNKEKIASCIALQEELGLDVLVHGEFERNDMVEYFGEHLEGYLFTQKAWVQSYGTRCVKPPVIWGDVSRKAPITVDWAVYAQSCSDKPVKGMLTGPVTILNWSFPREDISLKESTLQIALAIRDEVLDLEKNGISIIQIDEAALREKLPLRKSDWYEYYLNWAIPAFRLVASGVAAKTQIHTHMCYSEFTDIIPAIDAMDADVITFEASRSDLQILDSLKENEFRTAVGPGVYDIHSPRVPSVEEITQALEQMLLRVEQKKLWVNPDCGLKTRGETETKASLANLVTAAKQLRKQIQGEDVQQAG